MTLLSISIIDDSTGSKLPCKVRLLNSFEEFLSPLDSIKKIGPGLEFFYSDGDFTMDMPSGKAKILIERGTEYEPLYLDLVVPSSGVLQKEIRLKKWTFLGDLGWYPGNTHIHYDQNETRPDDRLFLDPRVENLRMTAVSILQRWNLDYATNKYPPGFLTDFSTNHHYVECGEENRHDATSGPENLGYGHIMLLNIKEIVEPVSRGLLVDSFDPDYPPLTFACDDARRQGGIVIWCHNGHGMEAPVAAALSKVDAFNLFDGTNRTAGYSIYYHMLNCGIKLPISTGSDWFICSGNRVYVYMSEEFNYTSWLNSLINGKSFITNGPVAFLNIENFTPGDQININSDKKLPVKFEWKSHYPINRAEVIFNGKVIKDMFFPNGSKEGQLEFDFLPNCNGWIAGRLSSEHTDSYFEKVFAHTSPIYISNLANSAERNESALFFVGSIEKSMEWIGNKGRYYNQKQRLEVLDLFKNAKEFYDAVGKQPFLI